MDTVALVVTLKLAFATTAILFVLGIPIALWLAASRWQWKFLLESLVAIPLVLPPTVLGFYLLQATSARSAIGRWSESWLGHSLPFTFSGILLGSVICNLPFAIRPFTAAFSGVDRRLVEAAWCLGESRWRTFWRVTLPGAWPGILAGLVLTFSHTIGEFGVVLMVGGNIPGVTRTLSVAIYDDVAALNYGAASQTSVLLILFSFVALCLVHRIGRKGPTP